MRLDRPKGAPWTLTERLLGLAVIAALLVALVLVGAVVMDGRP